MTYTIKLCNGHTITKVTYPVLLPMSLSHLSDEERINSAIRYIEAEPGCCGVTLKDGTEINANI